MMLLQHSMFCAIPPSQTPSVFTPSSLKQRNPFLHHLIPCPRKPRASTFRISSLLPSFFDDIVQIAQNKVLIAAGAAVAIGQLSKPFTSVFLYGKEFDIRAIIQAGGFPSSHSSATVASATLFGLERGFSDPIFGLTVVYAGLIMYDAQGVRREVGIHARTLNKLLLQMQANSLRSKDRDTLINSQPGLSKPLKVEGLEKSLLSQEATSLEPQEANTRLLIKSGSKIRQTDAAEISKLAVDGIQPLKESIGHTEIEVIAGAFLGFLVALAVYNVV
ncbi:membrane protein YuiD [Spatholobus suberectus]|nr:membrane protein YuiD [Spatholobus suberectus]